MPYIKPEQRKKWKKTIDEVVGKISSMPTENMEGELNYLISSILGKSYKPGYYNYNRAIGLLECIKLEFYRRKVAPYEDKKIIENGDVE